MVTALGDRRPVCGYREGNPGGHGERRRPAGMGISTAKPRLQGGMAGRRSSTRRSRRRPFLCAFSPWPTATRSRGDEDSLNFKKCQWRKVEAIFKCAPLPADRPQ